MRSWLVLLASCVLASCNQPDTQIRQIDGKPVSFVPSSLTGQCKGKRRILYDACTDQAAVFDEARKRAEAEGKTVLVSFGADWCIWCHVFDAYIGGQFDTFQHHADGEILTMSEELTDKTIENAKRLNAFAAENFVVAHIDSDAESGYAVIQVAKADAAFRGEVPLIFAVDRAGHFVGEIDTDRIEQKRDGFDLFRGLDREGLLDQLKGLRNRSR